MGVRDCLCCVQPLPPHGWYASANVIREVAAAAPEAHKDRGGILGCLNNKAALTFHTPIWHLVWQTHEWVFTLDAGAQCWKHEDTFLVETAQKEWREDRYCSLFPLLLSSAYSFPNNHVQGTHSRFRPVRVLSWGERCCATTVWRVWKLKKGERRSSCPFWDHTYGTKHS